MKLLKRIAPIAFASIVAAATVLLIAPALIDNRDQKLEIYRAFTAAYGEGNPINLARIARRFDARNEDVLACAPTVLVTTAISRRFRTVRFMQSDFDDPTVRVVDPGVQRALVHAYDPNTSIAAGVEVGEALSRAYEVGLLEVSDVGVDLTGRRALLTYSFTCGRLCGHSGTAILERRGGRWIRAEQNCGSDTTY